MNQQDDGQKPLMTELKEGLIEEGARWVRWTIGGAVVGAGVLGVVGVAWFGWKGLAIGCGVGAVAGGLGAWLLYLWLNSLWE